MNRLLLMSMVACAVFMTGCATFTATGLDLGASAGRTFQEGEGTASNYVGVKANVHYERDRK